MTQINPAVGDVVKDLGKIVRVFVGSVEVQGFNDAIAFVRVPTYQLKWNSTLNVWEVE